LQPRIRGPADFRPGGCGCDSRLSPADEPAPAPYLNSGLDNILAQPIYPTNKYLDVTLTSIFQSTRASSQPPHTGRRQPAGCKLQPPAPSPNQTPSRRPAAGGPGRRPWAPSPRVPSWQPAPTPHGLTRAPPPSSPLRSCPLVASSAVAGLQPATGIVICDFELID